MSRVYVAGSINMDIVASAPRHPSIGETIAGTSLDHYPGGKGANQAVAAARMGASSHLIGRLGDDSAAAKLRDFLHGMGVGLDNVRQTPGSPSGTALIVVVEGTNTVVAVGGANEALSRSDIDQVEMTSSDVLVAQLETPAQVTQSFFSRGKAAGARTILNPAPAAEVDRDLLELCDFVVLNETEFALLSGEDEANAIGSPEAMRVTVDRLRATKAQTWVVTLGPLGAIAFAADAEPVQSHGHDVAVVDSTGAGDCLIGSFAALLSRGNDPTSALAMANAAAALCVQHHGAGTSMPSFADVSELLTAG